MLKENNIHEGNHFVLNSPFADYSELGLIPLGLKDSRPSISACPFCNRPFKSPGAFATHLKKRHTGQSLPINQTWATSSNNHNSETASLKENSGEVNMRETLYSLFADYSELSDLIPPPFGGDKDERGEVMPYSDESLIGNPVNDSSDANTLLNDTIHFTVDREAGKIVAPYPFQKLRDSRYNFFRPFQNVMDYNLAHFFCSTRLPRTQVDEFFHKGFLSAQSDACRAIYSYQSVYTLYKKIDEMVIDPQWRNGLWTLNWPRILSFGTGISCWF